MIAYICGLNHDCSGVNNTGCSAETNAQGYYTINIPDSLYFNPPPPEDQKSFFICAKDPTNKYITECYDGYYFLYGSEGIIGGKSVIVKLNQENPTSGIDFSLCKSGNITADLRYIHRDRGYKITLWGTVNFKQTLNVPFEEREFHFIDPNYLPGTIHFAQSQSVGALPYGTYSVKLEDAHFVRYHSEVFNFSTMGLSSDYYPYEIDDIPYYATKYATNITISASTLSRTVYFSSQDALGMIYGVVTDENNYQRMSKIIRMQPEEDLGKSLVSYAKDPNSDESEINLILDPNHIAIYNIETEIIPVDGQSIEVATTIPTKILRDPNFNYWIGQYGGYAFKFLKHGGYKIRVFRSLGNTEVFSAYLNGANGELVYELDDAQPVNVPIGGGRVSADIKLPKVSIEGRVTIEGGGSVAGTIVNLLTSNHEQICFTMADPNNDNSFFLSELVTGNVIVRIAKSGGSVSYNVKKIELDDVRLGDKFHLGTIELKQFDLCSGDGKISGRVFWDEDPSVGIPNVKVRAADIEHIYADNNCTQCLTDSEGRFEITDLPNSAFLVYTDQNSESSEFFDEMYENITLFPEKDAVNDDEVEFLSAMIKKIDDDPTQVCDPSIIAKLVTFSNGKVVILCNGEIKEGINFGLSRHRYELFSGMNLFAYPGTPLQYYNQVRPIITSFHNFSPHKFMSFISSAESGNGISWNVADETSGNFPMEAGRGYLFYFEDNEKYDLKFPCMLAPFTTFPVDIELAGGLNFVSIPDGLDKGWRARHVLSDIQRVEGNARCISRYQAKAGKWKSMAPMWGRPAGEDFRIKREEGYLVHMKSPVSWSRD
ncbi:MAG: hypothetical protein ACMUIA_07845 [bacterium]